MNYKPLPIGVDNFEKLRENNYYYVDKSMLIKELLDNKGEVNLFTRPRRFGKTLNLSMLRCFFEKSGTDSRNFFEGLKIMDAGEKYISQLGQYPVISLSLKSGKQKTFDSAYFKLSEEIQGEFSRHRAIMEELPEDIKSKYQKILDGSAKPDIYSGALKFLSTCLEEYYHKKVILLIDEYDVPLENAYFEGFYEEMIGFIRSLFESVLKTNDSLEFAVITGCLRISKESIFTGLNNFEMISIVNEFYTEHFGFTQNEVEVMLKYYERSAQKEVVKDWYDGYLFGKSEVYNPWSVINYVKALTINQSRHPLPYWSNTSANDIVRSLVEHAGVAAQQEIECLIEGGSIEKPIFEDITYSDIYKSDDNLWNILFFTGYLKKVAERFEDEHLYMHLSIPNREILYIYKNTIMSWFEEKVKQKDFSTLYQAILNKDISTMEEIISMQLQESISYYDYSESFYHGFLVGVLQQMDKYIVISNRESGNGRPDIIIKAPTVRGIAIILEFKVTRDYNLMEPVCDEALAQIEERHYEQSLLDEGYKNIVKYGVAFYKKECMVKTSQTQE